MAMQQYKLLRNNIESGPYSFEELVRLQLKAYDLVWSEGKSASWKYPCEFEELMKYAPVAEDDLYSTVHHHENSSWPRSQLGTYTRKYVSVILPAREITSSVTDEGVFSTNVTESLESQLSVQNHSEKQGNRIYIAGALILLLSFGIYFGTSGKRSQQKNNESRNNIVPGMASMVSNMPGNNNDENNPSAIPPNPVLEFASLKRHLTLVRSDYSVGLFGGISGLKLSVTNTSSKPLQDVVVAIDFIQKNQVIHHTENLLIGSVQPSQTITIAVPESKYGVAIRTRIIGINGLGTVIEY